MRKFFKVVISFLIVGLLAVVGIYIFIFSRRHTPVQKACQDVYTVAAGNISSSLRLSGKVSYLISKDVTFPPTNACIKEKLVRDGDMVKKDQVLIRFNEEDLIYGLETARVKYLSAKNKLDEVKNWYSSSVYIGSKYHLVNSSAKCEDAEKRYKENLNLYQAKAISKQDLDRSELELQQARSDLEIAKAQFTETAAKGNEKALKGAQSEFIIADIDFRKGEAAMDYIEIVAPVSGVITIKQQQSQSPGSSLEKLLTENMAVSPGDIFMSISDQSRLAVDVQVDEFDVYQVKENQPCKISIPALPGKEFFGSVAFISSIASQESRSFFRVRCQIDQLDPPVMVGMSGNVEILLEEKKDVLVVPTSALVKKGMITGVYLAETGSLNLCPVSLGLNDGDLVEILDGLSAGQKILRFVPASLLDF